MTRLKNLWIVLVPLLWAVTINGQSDPAFELTFKEQDVAVLLNENTSVTIILSGPMTDTKANLHVFPEHDKVLGISPLVLALTAQTKEYSLIITGKSPGRSDVFTNYTSDQHQSYTFSGLFLRVTVAISSTIIHVSNVIGWIYFVAWSVSFYPQIYYNYQRKSVVGLNFDFLALNIVGFLMYSIFNIGLYWIPEMEVEYIKRYPTGLNPVQLNDVVFAIHAALATLVTIGQCFVYERGEQRVSLIARLILGIFGIAVIVFFILVATNTYHWLDFLYSCSYIKLAITLIKYIPQALMNYRRKSTVGWSIGNILLDFTGGILSMLQMILNAYNYDDWHSLFGDPTKFGLGLFSVCFDILFMVQHYILYRTRKNTGLKENSSNLESLLPKP